MEAYQPDKKFNFFPLFPFILAIHFLAVVGAVLYPPTLSLVILCLVMTFGPGLGVSMMYHRYHTHHAFKFKHKTLERFFTTLGALSLQRGPIWWASLHKMHHQASDTPQDPHNSNLGFWYAHLLWHGHMDLRWKWAYKITPFEAFAPDAAKDLYYRLLDRYYYAVNPLSWIVLYAVGGLPWLFWGGFIAIVFNWHNTWLINSASHLFGYRSFKTADNSKNNWLVGALALGDGWHNNHHAFPNSAKHGFFKWWEFDATFAAVWCLEKLGLVHEVKRVSTAQEKSKSTALLGESPASS